MERNSNAVSLTPSRAVSTATVADIVPCPKPRHDRVAAAATVIDFERAKLQAVSQRQFAADADVARSTLQGWVARKEAISCAPQVVAFCESPAGVQFLHRISTAAQYTFNKCGTGGIRQMSQFLELSGLKHFVGCSFGSMQKAAAKMDDNLIAYGDQRRGALVTADLTPRNVSVCEDETFFPKPCLVAIEPVSGFIFLEQYSDKRDAQSWNLALKNSLEGMPVNIIQAVSDEAKGLLSHAANGLGVHHSPDLFHGQHEIYKGFGPLLQSMLRKARGGLDDANERLAEQIGERDRYAQHVDQRGPGRPPDFDARIEAAKAAVTATNECVALAEAMKDRLTGEVRGIGADYHPFDLATGLSKQADDVARDLERRFDELHAFADALGLSEHARKHIDKSQRLVPQMITTIAFFWKMVATVLAGNGLPDEVQAFLHSHLIPLAYLELVQSKVRGKQRDVVRATIARLTASTQAATSPLAMLDAQARTLALTLARQCAEIFQRSSSCVEGRNGALSLYHHAGRSLTPRRLRALQIIHNFGIQRSDGTTAAERLTRLRQPDLFEWLLERQPLPVRPARAPRRLAANG